MQRAPCCCSFASGKCSWNSFQSFVRSSGERSCGSSRAISMNPVGLPISQSSLSLSRSVNQSDLKNIPHRYAGEKFEILISKAAPRTETGPFRTLTTSFWPLGFASVRGAAFESCLLLIPCGSVAAHPGGIVLVGVKRRHQRIVAHQSPRLGRLQRLDARAGNPSA